MKQVKKFMIVPYQDNESSPEKEKIRKIIDNKSINSERKIKLINTILIPKLHKENDSIFRENNTLNEQSKEGNQIFESPVSRAGPTSDTETNLQEYQPDILDNNKFDFDDVSENQNLNKSELESSLFDNADDYLPPFAQLRSKTGLDKSFLTLSKQKERTINKLKRRPQTPEKLKEKNIKQSVKRKAKEPMQNKNKKNKTIQRLSQNKPIINFSQTLPEIFDPNLTVLNEQSPKRNRKNFNIDSSNLSLDKSKIYNWTKYVPKKNKYEMNDVSMVSE